MISPSGKRARQNDVGLDSLPDPRPTQRRRRRALTPCSNASVPRTDPAQELASAKAGTRPASPPRLLSQVQRPAVPILPSTTLVLAQGQTAQRKAAPSPLRHVLKGDAAAGPMTLGPWRPVGTQGLELSTYGRSEARRLRSDAFRAAQGLDHPAWPSVQEALEQIEGGAGSEMAAAPRRPQASLKHDLTQLVWSLAQDAVEDDDGFVDGAYILRPARASCGELSASGAARIGAIIRRLEQEAALGTELYARPSTHLRGCGQSQVWGLDLPALPHGRQHLLIHAASVGGEDGGVPERFLFLKPERAGLRSWADRARHAVHFSQSLLRRWTGQNEAAGMRKERVPRQLLAEYAALVSLYEPHDAERLLQVARRGGVAAMYSQSLRWGTDVRPDGRAAASAPFALRAFCAKLELAGHPSSRIGRERLVLVDRFGGEDAPSRAPRHDVKSQRPTLSASHRAL